MNQSDCDKLLESVQQIILGVGNTLGETLPEMSDSANTSTTLDPTAMERILRPLNEASKSATDSLQQTIPRAALTSAASTNEENTKVEVGASDKDQAETESESPELQEHADALRTLVQWELDFELQQRRVESAALKFKERNKNTKPHFASAFSTFTANNETLKGLRKEGLTRLPVCAQYMVNMDPLKSTLGEMASSIGVKGFIRFDDAWRAYADSVIALTKGFPVGMPIQSWPKEELELQTCLLKWARSHVNSWTSAAEKFENWVKGLQESRGDKGLSEIKRCSEFVSQSMLRAQAQASFESEERFQNAAKALKGLVEWEQKFNLQRHKIENTISAFKKKWKVKDSDLDSAVSVYKATNDKLKDLRGKGWTSLPDFAQALSIFIPLPGESRASGEELSKMAKPVSKAECDHLALCRTQYFNSFNALSQVFQQKQRPTDVESRLMDQMSDYFDFVNEERVHYDTINKWYIPQEESQTPEECKALKSRLVKEVYASYISQCRPRTPPNGEGSSKG